MGDPKWNLTYTRRSERHPGRLLNVLCTFNLRPVPTGGRHVKMLEDYYEKWKIKSKIFFYFTVLL